MLLKAGDRVNFDTAIFEIGSHGAFEDSAQLKADLDATVLRSEVGAAEKETHSSEAVPSHASGADPEYQSGEGTMLMGADGLKEMQADLDAPQELESVDEPCLTVLSGNCKGKSFRLTGDQQILQWEIGSEGSRDIVIDDEGISAFHAKLVNEGDRWKLIDQMSANGTWVNQKKCNISYLRSGDRIRFALVECQVALPGADGIIDSAPAPISGKRFPWVTAGIAFVITLAAVYLLMQWF